ncbi:glycerate kinase [Pedosphaera parvula]|uniref:Glycerate kinase n=1 Tax=Pedosphaera parvula (strain Ellin514) TaxID=320771 RepID=B9XM09_PEDPL|nr:glycerate kinase [Pedosphaera parvula]EEF59137.1 Glycerate kinase [Pedosphaera parvula Ellin514]
MSLKVLIVPDKFKGTLTAHRAAEAIARGWRKARPQDMLELLPMSDGGDGFGAVMGEALSAKLQTIKTVDAADRPCTAKWWWDAKTKTAIIEAARINGLAQLPPGKYHPFNLHTFGIGKAILATANKGAKRCLVGIGGSATNDAGFGLARALGWEFIDRSGKPIVEWTELHSLKTLRAPKEPYLFEELLVAVDVQNTLLGRHGCTRIYGPQKGLIKKDFPLAEKALRRLATVVKNELGRDFACEPGAGAAGGLGFGFCAFLGGCMEPGFELFAEYAQLKKHLKSADLVITGEGAIDQSTLMGKGVGQMARWAHKLKIPCIGLAGNVAVPKNSKSFFAQARGLTELTTIKSAKGKPAYWLERLAAETARDWAE